MHTIINFLVDEPVPETLRIQIENIKQGRKGERSRLTKRDRLLTFLGVFFLIAAACFITLFAYSLIIAL